MADSRKEFSKIYDNYIEKIYRFIFFKVGSQEIAEDLCSECFLRGWERFQGSKKAKKHESMKAEIRNPQAFLYKIARNLVVDHYRERAKAQVVSTENIKIKDESIDIEGEIMLKSDINSIRLALSDLKDDYQNVIILHYLDDLSMSETAGILDRTEGATRVLLHRALKALRAEIS